MAVLTDKQKSGLNVAFNEARLLGAEVATEDRIAAITLSVLTLPPDGPSPEDPRVQILLYPVGRVAASYRQGHWNDEKANVVPFEIDYLLEIVESFKTSIYGWKFFDDQDDYETWRNRSSLDIRLGDDGMSHSLCLFQSEDKRTLDMPILQVSFRTNILLTHKVFFPA